MARGDIKDDYGTCPAQKGDGSICGGKATKTGYCRPHSRGKVSQEQKKIQAKETTTIATLRMKSDNMHNAQGGCRGLRAYIRMLNSWGYKIDDKYTKDLQMLEQIIKRYTLDVDDELSQALGYGRIKK